MNQFARAALYAVELCKKGCKSPQAWQKAINEYTESEYSRGKPCPRNTFLGLCSDGLITGIPKGEYLQKLDSVERFYARKAVDYLKKYPEPLPSPQKLWERIGNINKHHDSQMNIVLALWEKGLIN